MGYRWWNVCCHANLGRHLRFDERSSPQEWQAALRVCPVTRLASRRICSNAGHGFRFANPFLYKMWANSQNTFTNIGDTTTNNDDGCTYGYTSNPSGWGTSHSLPFRFIQRGWLTLRIRSCDGFRHSQCREHSQFH